MCRERVHDVSKRWLGGRCKTTVGDARKSVGTIEPLTAPLEADFPFVFVFFHVLTLGKKKIRASSRTYLPPFKLVSTRRGGSLPLLVKPHERARRYNLTTWRDRSAPQLLCFPSQTLIRKICCDQHGWHLLFKKNYFFKLLFKNE